MNSLFDLARVTTATVGTGTIALGAAVSGSAGNFLTFAQAGVPDGAVVSYAIFDPVGGGSEVGKGTYTASGTTLSRDTVYRSTGAGNTAKIALSGSAQVFISPVAEDFAAITLGTTAFKLGDTVGTISGITLNNATLSGTTLFPGGHGSGITTDGNIFVGAPNKLLFGNASGDAPITHSNILLPLSIASGAAVTDAKQLFYDLSSSNWAGEGVDNSGNYWRKTGSSPHYVVHFASGGVYVGDSPVDPGNGNLFVAGKIGIGTGSPAGLLTLFNSSVPYLQITDGTRLVNFGIDTTGGTTSTFLASSAGVKLSVNSGISYSFNFQASGGFSIGTTTDPGAGNLLVTGTIASQGTHTVTHSYSANSSYNGYIVQNIAGVDGATAVFGLQDYLGNNRSYIKFNGNSGTNFISTIGLHINTGGADVEAVAIDGSANATFAGVMRSLSTPTAGFPVGSGSGIEAGYYSIGDYAYLQSYDRTGSAFKPLRIEGAPLAINFASKGAVGIARAPINGTALAINAGTDQNLIIQGKVSLADGIVIQSVNDAFSANEGIEFRANQYVFYSTGISAGDYGVTVGATWTFNDVKVTNNFTAGGTVRTGVYTVATLPTAGAIGRRAMVSDASAPTFGSVVVGGGANATPVYDSGVAWGVG